ncbi:MAG TPA: hypothetical protein VMB81_13675 [Candidatus Sulfotelmatobacter sp.]|nr:hypothetical protein [Candidatus Sulfotelmatobacter sp.]
MFSQWITRKPTWLAAARQHGSSSTRRAMALAAALLIALVPSLGWACACGCGVFDVGTGTNMPTAEGGTAFLEWDFMDQTHDWHNTSSALPGNDPDKELKTHFLTAGVQYMFNRTWGVMGELPYWDRYLTTTQADGSIRTFNASGIGDIRIRGMYTGFSEDLSTGLTFGLKLPTGSDTANGLDRDSQIGTGSTDVLLGGYHVGQLTADNKWNWFANGQIDQPVLKTTDYRPGTEIDGLLGVYFNDWTVMNDAIKLVPIAQTKVSWRWRDVGQEADFADSGYQRVYLSPGMEMDVGRYRLYADVALPVYTHTNGYQIVAYELFKVIASINF